MFWTLFKNVHCQGPWSLRPCISRPYCINLGDHFCKKHFFLNLIFELLYFLKSCPIFDKLQWFPLSILIFGLKSCLFRTHHVSNSTTKMILLSTYVQVHTSYGIAKAIPELEVLEIWWVLKSSVVNCATTCSLEFLVIIGITTLFPLSLVNSWDLPWLKDSVHKALKIRV